MKMKNILHYSTNAFVIFLVHILLAGCKLYPPTSEDPEESILKEEVEKIKNNLNNLFKSKNAPEELKKINFFKSKNNNSQIKTKNNVKEFNNIYDKFKKLLPKFDTILDRYYANSLTKEELIKKKADMAWWAKFYNELDKCAKINNIKLPDNEEINKYKFLNLSLQGPIQVDQTKEEIKNHNVDLFQNLYPGNNNKNNLGTNNTLKKILGLTSKFINFGNSWETHRTINSQTIFNPNEKLIICDKDYHYIISKPLPKYGVNPNIASSDVDTNETNNNDNMVQIEKDEVKNNVINDEIDNVTDETKNNENIVVKETDELNNNKSNKNPKNEADTKDIDVVNKKILGQNIFQCYTYLHYLIKNKKNVVNDKITKKWQPEIFQVQYPKSIKYTSFEYITEAENNTTKKLRRGDPDKTYTVSTLNKYYEVSLALYLLESAFKKEIMQAIKNCGITYSKNNPINLNNEIIQQIYVEIEKDLPKDAKKYYKLLMDIGNQKAPNEITCKIIEDKLAYMKLFGIEYQTIYSILEKAKSIELS